MSTASITNDDTEKKIVVSRSVVRALINYSVVMILVFVFLNLLEVQLLVVFLVLCLIVFYGVVGFLKKTPVTVVIDTEAGLFTVVFTRLLIIKSGETYNLNEVKAILKYFTGARGAKLKELEIDIRDKQIFSLRANQDGWSLEKLEKLYDILNHRE